MSGSNALSHEIGLVSLGTNQEPRYIGPSSGYFLARVMLSKPPRHQERTEQDPPFPRNMIEAIQGPLPLPPRSTAKQLCDAYFEAIHPQYPSLHEPTFLKMLDQAYEQETPDAVVSFQVYMVLAIGATVLCGRLKAQIPAESYCLSAFQHFDRLNISNSLQGLQCLILLLVFSIHNPHVRVNVWYLNYQCIAALLDLGLQRDINTHSGISLLEQEMRARIFWVVFMLDRTIATMMGRPIGLRDEACELRVSQQLLCNIPQLIEWKLPQGLDDSILSTIDQNNSIISNEEFTPISYSIHLFRLSKLNSEIKYVANSVVRGAPQYAYPTVIDIHGWQDNMLQQLDQWETNIPISGGNSASLQMDLICRLRYHSLRMLLLRPSPAIPKPSTTALGKCHDSSRESIRIFDQLYKKNLLTHSWMTFHSLVLSTLTMLYCIKVAPSIAVQTKLDILMGDLSIGLSILSATGEHWSGAKRSRDILDELGRSTIRWLQELPDDLQAQRQAKNPALDQTDSVPSFVSLNGDDIAGPLNDTVPFTSQVDPDLLLNPFDDFLPGASFAEYFESTESVNVDHIVRDLFQDFIPTYPAFT